MRYLLALLIASSSLAFPQLEPSDRCAAQVAMKAIRAEAIRAHMRFLADSLLEGRAPGTRGYDIAAAYVATQLEGMGLQPAGANGRWFQPVPLRKFKMISGQSSLEFVRSGKAEALVFGKDYVTEGDPEHTDSALDASLVFAGYGVSAPELKYDDYAGLDVRGKVVVVLWGAPARFPSVQRAYFSDVVMKQRSAAEHGATGFMLMMTPEDEKRFPWRWLVPQVQAGGMKWLDTNSMPHDTFSQLRGGVLWLSQDAAERLFTGAPQSLHQVFAEARDGRVGHFPLTISMKMHMVSQHLAIESTNIIGMLPGADSKLGHEYVVYSAHLDHLGICPAVNGDKVCHGAWDNASGTAAVLEIAQAFAQLRRLPLRSILFAFVTGEENGLLGSDYFAHHPTVPAEAMVANINIDAVPGMLYPLKDIVALGADDSSLGHNVADAARQLGVEISPDPSPEEVFFIRSDQYPLVRRGVPAVLIREGFKSADPMVNGEQIFKTWLATVYHTPKDDMNGPWDFESAAKSTELNFLVGFEVAQQLERPTWNTGDFFGVKFGTNREQRK